MSREPLPPEELVEQIVAGDAEAESLLVDRYARPLRALLRQRLREWADVEDFLQSTFRLAVEKIRGGEVKEPAKIGSFLTSLARNLVIEHFRRGARRKTETDADAVARYPSAEAEPEARLIAAERATLVRRLVDELETPRDRDLLRRFYLAEEEKQSICKDLGLSPLHFNRVLHRARQRYKQIFEAHSGAHRDAARRIAG
jgi:RNA polymerase sigma-70 factor (ECF subfamily)